MEKLVILIGVLTVLATLASPILFYHYKRYYESREKKLKEEEKRRDAMAWVQASRKTPKSK